VDFIFLQKAKQSHYSMSTSTMTYLFGKLGGIQELKHDPSKKHMEMEALFFFLHGSTF
jgi:hypothetical protein